MSKIRLTLAVATLVLVGACSDLEKSANDAANDIKTSATEAAKQTALEAAKSVGKQLSSMSAEEMTNEICQLTRDNGVLVDGSASEAEKVVLKQFAKAAETAGVPSEFAGPIDAIANGSSSASEAGLTKLKQACNA